MSAETIICGGCWDGEDAAPIWGSWSVGNWVLAGAWILVLLMSIRIFWHRQPGLPFSLFAFFSVVVTVGFVWQELFSRMFRTLSINRRPHPGDGRGISGRLANPQGQNGFPAL